VTEPRAGVRPAHPQDRELRTDHLMQDIGSRSKRGGAIMFVAQVIKVVAQFGAVVVLARLLPPAAFGLVAMTVALSAILEPIRELGLSSATIQKAEITHAQVSTLFWINVALGAAVGLGLFLAAPLVAAFYGQDELVAVTHWLALSFFIGGFGAQHWALLRRQMRFGAVAIMETGAELVGFALAIVLALMGADYWALIAQRLVSATIVLVGCLTLCRWRPGLPSRDAGVRDLFAYGISLTGTTVLGLLTRNLDQVLIGWFWGPNLLGLYERAARLLMVPINNIAIPFYSVGMPALSRLADQAARYRRAYAEMLEKLAMITMPGAALIAITADWTTSVLFGPQWAGAAPVVACFAVVALYQPSVLAVNLLFMTQNRAGEMLRANIMDASLSLAAIAGALTFGVTAVAASLAATGVIIRLPLIVWLATRRGPTRAIDVWMTLAAPAVAALLVVASVASLRLLVLPPDISPVLGFVVTVPAAGVSAVVGFCLFAKTRQTLAALWRMPRLFLKPAEG
jgi:polysaccharide transporter, PST family